MSRSMLILRYMRLEDIQQVVAIDRQAFDPPWSPQSYAYEIQESTYSHMVVLEEKGPPAAVRPVSTGHWWQRFRHYLNGNGSADSQEKSAGRIVGYGGLWRIMTEAHISTIATHPDYRGRGYGEALLAGMVQRALTLGAQYVVLEVRVSNHTAQNLYRKYGFETVDTKVNYYRSNNEDAYDMRVQFSDDYRPKFEALYRAIQARCPFDNQYSSVEKSAQP